MQRFKQNARELFLQKRIIDNFSLTSFLQAAKIVHSKYLEVQTVKFFKRKKNVIGFVSVTQTRA
jgi:hypothetical protein